jgi:hypothetical protein
MEHHLEFWPVPLTEKPQPLAAAGVGGTFTGIISPAEVAKSSIFASCRPVFLRVADRQAAGLNGQWGAG